MIKSKIKFVIPFISIFVFIFFAFRVSYSYFVYDKEVANINLNSGEISINFTKDNNTSNVSANQMMSDAEGKVDTDYLEFTVTGTADTESILYELEIVPNNGNSIDSKYIKYYLTEVDNNNETPLTAPLLYTELYDSMVNSGKGIYQSIISGNQDGSSKTTIKKYRLRAWVDKSYEGESNKRFNYSVYLYAINVDSSKYERLTFDFNDSSGNVLTKYIEKNGTYGSLPMLSREGYSFEGWIIKDNNLPADYQIVEYIESNGTQHILTDVVPTNNFKLVADVYQPSSYTGESTFAGVRETDNSGELEYYFSNGISGFWLNNGSTSKTLKSSSKYYDEKIHYKAINKLSNISLSINGKYIGSDAYTYNGGNNTPLMIFAYNSKGTPSYMFRGRIYSLKLYNNEEIIRQFVPCKQISTNEIGLYETIEGKFYAKVTGDTFGSGANINSIDTHVTSTNKVQATNNYVLKATWEEVEPKLELSKITYINVPFDDSWTYDSHAHVEDDKLVFSDTETANPDYSYAKSDYIDVNNEFWYMTFDGYVEDNTTYYGANGGIGGNTYYYDDTKNSTVTLDNYSSNGWAVNFPINNWQNDIIWRGSVENFKSSKRYGPNVKYIKLYFKCYTNYSKSSKIRDLKVYGQMENDFYLINVDASAAEGIEVLKYAKGNQSVDYFKSNGINVVGNQIKVLENGIYTVYVKGNSGNSVVKTIEITNIV